MHDPNASNTPSERPQLNRPDVVLSLGDLPQRALISVAGLATALCLHVVSVRRMIQRGELPRPRRLGCRRFWTVRAIVEHLEAE